MEERVFYAALAGLLHDVGKFAQRAGVGLTETWGEEAKKDYGYQHALASYGFVKAYLPEIFRKDISGAAYHHRPKTQHDAWIQLADWLSSAEREEDEDNHIPLMESVFSHLSGYNQSRYIPLARLDPSNKESIFPFQLGKNHKKDDTQRIYVSLWEDFISECRLLEIEKITNSSICLETIFSLLQEFTWCIPSAFWQSVPDVSLFDHLRTTAAIAACLAKDNRSKTWCEQARKDNEQICYLVGADLSGLQNFIYTLASSGAAKSLRARSFYVQLISDVMAWAVLDRLELPLTNIIYVGGGGFQMLVPLVDEQNLEVITRELTDRMLVVHQGALGLTLKWLPIRYADFSQFNLIRDDLGKQINEAKSQPFAVASPEKLFEAIGQPLTQGGDQLKFCHVTGEDGEFIHKDRDGEFKSRFVISLEELGRQLPKASYLLLTSVKPEPPEQATDWRKALRTFGTDIQIIIDDKPIAQIEDMKDAYYRVWRLEAFRNLDKERKSLQPLGDALHVVTYRPFAKLTPLSKEGQPKTFDELAQPRQGGFKRWGVLRMDVDNLGKLFREGFGEKASLSRLASLSFALRLFFEGWLPSLAKSDPNDPLRKDDLRNYLYLQYSGGDDLFVVGAWDVLPEFARRIRQSFEEYTANNPDVTLSAGISIVETGFPLYQAARQAGDAEADAKSYKRTGGKEKNAISFLGHTLDWDTFIEVKSHAQRLAIGIENNRLPKALLQTLLSLYQQIQFARRNGSKPIYGRWTWMAAYQLTRLSLQIKEIHTEDKEYIKSLRGKFIVPTPETEALGLAARWAQYLTRGG